jgi:hypothetical protein
MRIQPRFDRSNTRRTNAFSLDKKLASYLAASASIGAVMATEAQAIVISNNDVQNVGINGFANIDFNSDGQTDFQIDHDRVDLGGGNLVDYLQLDKNDVNGASPGELLYPSDFQQNFPTNGTIANDNVASSHVVQNGGNASSVEYPTALLSGAEIGPSSVFDFQEGDNVHSTHKIGRFNRLIDEDHGQADVALNGKTPNDIFTPTNSPQFTGVENLTRYLGVKMELNNTGDTNLNYGWIGIKVTNEADATAQVVGWGYETEYGVPILAGTTGARGGDYNNDGKVDTADYVLWRKGGDLQNQTVTAGANTPEDYTPWRINYGATSPGSGSGLGAGNAVPEPGSALLSLISGLGLAFVYICRRIREK